MQAHDLGGDAPVIVNLDKCPVDILDFGLKRTRIVELVAKRRKKRHLHPASYIREICVGGTGRASSFQCGTDTGERCLGRSMLVKDYRRA